jgi:hypothetical protein
MTDYANIVETYGRGFGFGRRHGYHGGHYGYGPGGLGWYGFPVYPPYYQPIYYSKPEVVVEEKVKPEVIVQQPSPPRQDNTMVYASVIIGILFIILVVLMLKRSS